MQADEQKSLTLQLASRIARTWVRSRVEAVVGQIAQSQILWLMDELGQLCAAETIRQQGDQDKLCELLSDAFEIIESVWYVTVDEIARRQWPDDKLPTEEQKKAVERAKHIVWVRHDPMEALNAGFNSKHYIGFDQKSFSSTVADYLSRPWLQHQVLDWIFVDVTISRELCAYGEHLKQQVLPGRREPINGFHKRYFKTDGNLREMQKFEWRDALWHLNIVFWAVIGFPVISILSNFYSGRPWNGWWLAGYCAVAIISFSSFWLFRLISRTRSWLSGKNYPRMKAFVLWEQMYKVWKQLEGPVVKRRRLMTEWSGYREGKQKTAATILSIGQK